MGRLGAVLERLWGDLGTSWDSLEASSDVLGRSWVVLEPSCSHLGAVLGRLVAILGQSWSHLGASMGRLGAVFGRPWGVLKLLLVAIERTSKIIRKKTYSFHMFFQVWGRLGRDLVAVLGRLGRS